MIYYKHSVVEIIMTPSVCYENLLYHNKWQQYEEQHKNVFLFAFHIHLVNMVSAQMQTAGSPTANICIQL